MTPVEEYAPEADLAPFAMFAVFVPTLPASLPNGKLAIRDALTRKPVRLAAEPKRIGSRNHVGGTVIDSEGGLYLVEFPSGPCCWVRAGDVVIPVMREVEEKRAA